MKITPADRKAINAYARTVCLNGFSHTEASYRGCTADHPDHDDDHLNLAFFTPECRHDLVDFVWLRDLKEVEDHPSGRVEIDFYVYSRHELETNITAEWQDGKLVRVYDPTGTVIIKRVPGDGSTWL